MAVNKTESQIPGGIENISRLSDSVCIKDSIALVSYLPSPLVYLEAEGRLVENKYVVMFGQEPSDATNLNYKWRIRLYRGDDTSAYWESDDYERNTGVFILDRDITSNIWCLEDAERIEVLVRCSTGFNLNVLHEIELLPKEIRDVFMDNFEPMED